MSPPAFVEHDRQTGFARALPSDLTAVEGVCRQARALLARHGQGTRAFAVDLLLRELLNNAILHGNRSVRRRRVEVSVTVGRRWIVLRVADEGPGFNWRARPRGIPDATATTGRGLAIVAGFAQRIRFNRSGNRVAIHIRKCRKGRTRS